MAAPQLHSVGRRTCFDDTTLSSGIRRGKARRGRRRLRSERALDLEDEFRLPDSAIYGRLDHHAFALGRPPLVDYGIRRYAIGSRRRKLILVHAVGLRRHRRSVGEDRRSESP